MHSPFVMRHNTSVTRADRNRLNKHESGLIRFTGLSASGKSTIAHAVEKELFKRSIRTYVLDGDNVRHGINRDLGFSRVDRAENLRRIVEIAKLFVDAGIVVLTAFISPFQKDREYVRSQFANDHFFEIYVKCSLEECERRDPKGQYKRARAGIIKDYTGISSPYEEPQNPDLVLDTEVMSPNDAVAAINRFLHEKGFLRCWEKG